MEDKADAVRDSEAGDDMESSRDGFAIAAMEARHCAAWSSHHVGRK